MTYALKAVALVAAILLGAVSSQFLSSRGVAGSGTQVASSPEPASAKADAREDDRTDEPQPRPHVRSRGRALDLPLQHAILREEKK